MEADVWGPTAEGLAISISVAKKEYRAVGPIILNLALKNVSKRPTPIAVRSAWADYAVRVWFEGQGEVLKTEFARTAIETANEGRRMSVELQPAQIQSDSLDISKGFDLSRPGVYSVTATRETFKLGNTSEFAAVTSNILIIRIVP